MRNSRARIDRFPWAIVLMVGTLGLALPVSAGFAGADVYILASAPSARAIQRTS